jgi:integrase
MERAVKLAKADTFTEAQARSILGGILERCATGESFRCPSTDQFFKDWLTMNKVSKAEGTAENYEYIVRQFLAHLGDRATARPLTSLTPRQVQGFIEARAKSGLSAGTVQASGNVIRTVLNRARRQGLVTVNVAEAVDLPKSDPVERGSFTPAEVKLLVDAAEGEWKTLIMLAYYSGARLRDCCGMTWESVDLANGTLTFTQGKTGKPVTVPIHPALEAHLGNLASCDTPEKHLMPGLSGKRTGGDYGLSTAFKNIMRKAGVDSQPVERDEGVRTLSRRTFHALRHSFTSALANAGVAPELRMKLTGHKTEAIHQGYTHHELETLRAAITKLPSL